MFDLARCGNPACGHYSVSVFINGQGGGSKYCLDGCGFYVEIPLGTMYVPERDPVEPPRPKEKKKR